MHILSHTGGTDLGRSPLPNHITKILLVMSVSMSIMRSASAWKIKMHLPNQKLFFAGLQNFLNGHKIINVETLTLKPKTSNFKYIASS